VSYNYLRQKSSFAGELSRESATCTPARARARTCVYVRARVAR